MGEKHEFRASDLRYGVCVGGPTDGRMLAHHEPIYRLAINVVSGKSLPGVVIIGDLWVKFGEYRFEDRKWHWTPPVEVS